jgi:hypothetical protein
MKSEPHPTEVSAKTLADADAEADAATKLLRVVVHLEGMDPHLFSAAFVSNESICVRGGGCAAFYPLDGWLEKFTRHLHAGYFGLPQAH